MFRNVIVVEDHQVANLSVQYALKELGIEKVDYAYYCDHAFTWINNALREGIPYDLLVTDLYFEDDGQSQQLLGGLDLIRAIRNVQPDLRVIIFSAESKPAVLKSIFGQLRIEGYVRKARRDGVYFKQAVEALASGNTYRSPDIEQLLHKDRLYEFSPVDMAIIELLAEGVLQKEIPERLRQQGIRPSSLSSVEKKLYHMKDMLGFGKNEQLVAYCKDLGVI